MDYSVFRAKPGSIQSKAGEIAEAIRAGIQAGELTAGARLAAAAAIGRAFHCSGKPVEVARNKLIKEGLIAHREGHYVIVGAPAEVSAAPPVVDQKAADEKLEAAFADLLDERPQGAR